MLRQLIDDIKQMCYLSEKIGELRVLYRNEAEIKRGKMPNTEKLQAMQNEETNLFRELLHLKRKWGIIN